MNNITTNILIYLQRYIPIPITHRYIRRILRRAGNKKHPSGYYIQQQNQHGNNIIGLTYAGYRRKSTAGTIFHTNNAQKTIYIHDYHTNKTQGKWLDNRNIVCSTPQDQAVIHTMKRGMRIPYTQQTKNIYTSDIDINIYDILTDLIKRLESNRGNNAYNWPRWQDLKTPLSNNIILQAIIPPHHSQHEIISIVRQTNNLQQHIKVIHHPQGTPNPIDVVEPYIVELPNTIPLLHTILSHPHHQYYILHHPNHQSIWMYHQQHHTWNPILLYIP